LEYREQRLKKRAGFGAVAYNFWVQNKALRGLLMGFLLAACSSSGVQTPQAQSTSAPAKQMPAQTALAKQPAAPETPTPDPPRNIPTSGVITTTYTVRYGDTLSGIAAAIDASMDDLQRINNLPNAAAIRAGQDLLVLVRVEGRGPSIKLLPDGEVVNGPAAVGFDLRGFVESRKGYLTSYTEKVDGEIMTGWQVIQRVSEQHSVNPRLLLAALAYSGGWVDDPSPSGAKLQYPLGSMSGGKTLYYQLSWAAARLNEGYYGWRLGTRLFVRFGDGSRAYVGDRINAGTAAAQNYLAAVTPRAGWAQAAGEGDGAFIQTYRKLFGDSWAHDTGVPIPANTKQPPLALPFSRGEMWYFTGGPHAAWSAGTPWGALDFAAASTQGCSELSEWVTASASGKVARSALGEVVQSLDASGDERVGWSVLYLHIGTIGRATAGAMLALGDPVGHPSCEGGAADGAHVHLVRKYNGEWITAGGSIPFVLDGWTAYETDTDYEGFLRKGDQTREALQAKQPEKNGLVR